MIHNAYYIHSSSTVYYIMDVCVAFSVCICVMQLCHW